MRLKHRKEQHTKLKHDALIAEENTSNRAFLRDVLRSLMFQVKEVTDIREIEKYCAERKPEICVISMGFPEWKKEVIRGIKAVSPETRVILSADQSVSIFRVMEGIGAGAERNYLTKPYRREEVEGIITKFLA